MKNKLLYSALLFGSALAFTGCNDDDEPETVSPTIQTTNGEEMTVGSGKATSWTRTSNGNIEAMGITFNEAAFNSFGDTTAANPSELDFDMPAVATSQAGVTHLTWDWNPQGHDPAFAYAHPHFDFHFYMITRQERMNIAPAPDTIPVNPQHIAPNYWYGAPPAFAVPMMGVHYVDTTSHEFHGQMFDKTFIYGYFQSNMAFLEPMITKAYLQSHPNATFNIPQPAAFKRTGLYYPTKYSVKYDSSKQEYTVALEGYVKH